MSFQVWVLFLFFRAVVYELFSMFEMYLTYFCFLVIMQDIYLTFPNLTY